MSTQPAYKEKPNDVNPNALQGRASNPRSSSWVSASAGSGKTKVLTDRILRLLMPQRDGEYGSSPEKILALTFTKAAASEMSLRIQNKLSAWATIEESVLKKQLETLLERTPTDHDIKTARRLFANVIDTQNGIPIMTIHSFCQSILSRFPLESSLSPQTKPLEEAQAVALLKKARQKAINQAREEKSSPLAQALSNLTKELNEEQFDELFSKLLSERSQLREILDNKNGIEQIYTDTCALLNITPRQTEEDAFLEFIRDLNKDELCHTVSILSESKTKMDQARAEQIKSFLEDEEKQTAYTDYKKVFLTDKGIPRSSIASKKISDLNNDVKNILQRETSRILAFEEDKKAIKCATLTRDIFTVGESIVSFYDELKSQESSLDFDDLILKTLDLLEGRSMNMKQGDVSPWIRFKLDQGIDHILVDEAQDTNPEQWKIIQCLCDDFFSGDTATEKNRSIFVVGDEKQSIFSFQRASPEKFSEVKDYFSDRIKNANKIFDPIDINISFRTVRSILECVDCVFDDLPLHNDMHSILEHKAFRRGQPGFVELWPVFEAEKQDNTDFWKPPVDIIEAQSGASLLAEHIGKTVQKWIDNKEYLESHDRPIEAGDIMILVRTRTKFIDQLIRALKTRNIPVNGIDRMVLNDQLVVQDLCACAHFALLPDDDLTLACVLKSPFIGWTDQQLEKFAFDRKSTLWQVIKENADSEIILWLSGLIKKANDESPFNFFSHLIQKSCPAHQFSGLSALKKRLGEDVIDPLDEFLDSALSYEKEFGTSLQSFLHHHEKISSGIKREMEESNNAIRIMTVHGSKGLQAPIVILPDTIRQGLSKTDRLLWPLQSKEAVPVFAPRKNDAPKKYIEAQGNVQELLEQEYKRLLYVAMTRAENRLYVGGYTGKKKPSDESWYFYIKNAFEKLEGVEEQDDGSLRFSNTQSAEPDKKASIRGDLNDTNIEKPAWLHKAMPEEPTPPQPLVPSRPSGDEVPALSPLKGDDQYRFRRGNLTHILLQTLPDLPASQWEDSIQKYLNENAQDLSDSLCQNIAKETLQILRDPEFSAIFCEGSMAEVPITGLLDDKTLISGQIDRLLITNEEILIIDYKTNRPPPKEEKDVPSIYRNQLRSYARALVQIYPDRDIKTALLWTDGPHLMPIHIGKI